MKNWTILVLRNIIFWTILFQKYIININNSSWLLFIATVVLWLSLAENVAVNVFAKYLLIFIYFLLVCIFNASFHCFKNNPHGILWCLINDIQVYQLIVFNIVSEKQPYMDELLIYFIFGVFQNHRTTLKSIDQAAHLVSLCLKYIPKIRNCH